MLNPKSRSLVLLSLLLPSFASCLPGQTPNPPTALPNGRLLGEVPGHPRGTNNLATAAAVSPDGRFVVFLHSGYGAYSEDSKHNYQSLSVLNLATDTLADFSEQ